MNHTYEWLASHIWVIHMNESCHTHEWVTSHTWVTHMNESESRHTFGSRTWMSYVTHMSHPNEWVTGSTSQHTQASRHTWMRHVTHMNELRHRCEWVTSHIWMRHVTHMNESRHIYEWDMSHTWMSYVTYMNETCHTHEWVTSPTSMRKSHGMESQSCTCHGHGVHGAVELLSSTEIGHGDQISMIKCQWCGYALELARLEWCVQRACSSVSIYFVLNAYFKHCIFFWKWALVKRHCLEPLKHSRTVRLLKMGFENRIFTIFQISLWSPVIAAFCVIRCMAFQVCVWFGCGCHVGWRHVLVCQSSRNRGRRPGGNLERVDWDENKNTSRNLGSPSVLGFRHLEAPRNFRIRSKVS